MRCLSMLATARASSKMGPLVAQVETTNREDRGESGGDVLVAEMVERRGREDVDHLGDDHFRGSDALLTPLDTLKQAKACLALPLVVSSQEPDEDVSVNELHLFLSILAVRCARSSLAILTISSSLTVCASGGTER